MKQEADKLLAAGVHGAGQLVNANDGTRTVKMEDGEQDMGVHVGMGIGNSNN